MHTFVLPEADVSAAFLLLADPFWAFRLHHAGGGCWVCRLPLTPGRYAYRIVTFREQQRGDRSERKRPRPIVSPAERVLEVVGPVP